jgi:hypothetical protein
MIALLALGVVGVIAWWMDRMFRRQEKRRYYGWSATDEARRRQWVQEHRVRTADDEFWDEK